MSHVEEQRTGKIEFIQVQETGQYGPPSDPIIADVIIGLDTNLPGQGFGFTYKTNDDVARLGMLNVLLDAFNNNWTTTVYYFLQNNHLNGIITRVHINKEKMMM
jgi:hypothetical protein